MEGLVTKTLEAGNIEIINKPSGYEITRNTQLLHVVLIRGTCGAVDAVGPPKSGLWPICST